MAKKCINVFQSKVLGLFDRVSILRSKLIFFLHLTYEDLIFLNLMVINHSLHVFQFIYDNFYSS